MNKTIEKIMQVATPKDVYRCPRCGEIQADVYVACAYLRCEECDFMDSIDVFPMVDIKLYIKDALKDYGYRVGFVGESTFMTPIHNNRPTKEEIKDVYDKFKYHLRTIYYVKKLDMQTQRVFAYILTSLYPKLEPMDLARILHIDSQKSRRVINECKDRITRLIQYKRYLPLIYIMKEYRV